LGAALVLILTLGAAAPKDMTVQDAQPLLPQSGHFDDVAPAKIVTVQNANFQAAPIPNQDVDAPPDASNPSAQVGPTLLSTKSLFQGDGYYHTSSQQNTLDARRQPAAGLGLSVPVN
jgi:hypothetical protein